MKHLYVEIPLATVLSVYVNLNFLSVTNSYIQASIKPNTSIRLVSWKSIQFSASLEKKFSLAQIQS